MSELLLIVVVIAALAIGGIGVVHLLQLRKLADEFMNFRHSIPGKPLLESLIATNQSLTNVLNEQQKLLHSMPVIVSEKIAEQIRIGISPLQHEIHTLTVNAGEGIRGLTTGLGQSHEHFIKALLTVNNDGHFREWVGAFREAIEPLEKATHAIDSHYSTASSLLEQSSDFVNRWAGHWQIVSEKFSRFSEEFERWAVAETKHARDIEHRIMNRLEEVAQWNHSISESLSEFQKTKALLIESTENLSESMRQVSSRIIEIQNLNEKTQIRQGELIEHQKEFQDTFQNWQQQIGQQTQAVQNQTAHMVSKVGDSLEKAILSFEQGLTRITNICHDREIQLNAMVQKMTASFEEQVQLIKDEKRFLEKLDKIVYTLPSRSLQLASLIVQALIFILGVAYVFSN